MTFKEFRKVVQDYCREFGLPFQSRIVYTALHRKYKEQRIYGQVDDDIAVALFLDRMEDMLITMNEFNMEVSRYKAVMTAEAPFGYCEAMPMPPVAKPKACKEKESTMNTERYYLSDRIAEVYCKFNDNLETQFHITNDKTPRTAADVIARIQAGKYIAPDAKSDHGLGSIVWRDPAVPADKAGYDAAYAQLTAAKQTAKDVIMTQDNAAGLAALNAFMAWTPTAATTTTAN